MTKFRRIVVTAALFAASATLTIDAKAAEPPLPLFDAVYAVNWNGISVGDAAVSLKADTASGCYLYTTTTKPIGFIRALYGSPNQSSRFCVEGGRVRAQRYESVLEGDDKQSYVLNFDYAKRLVTDENGLAREIPDEAVDGFTLQQAVRLWVKAHAGDSNPPVAEFTMVDRSKLTYYQLKLTGRETVQTPAGSFNAVKMERVDNPDKMARFWLAPERDYLPVKIETKNDNKPKVVLQLKG